jgi:hypothetical protein
MRPIQAMSVLPIVVGTAHVTDGVVGVLVVAEFV